MDEEHDYPYCQDCRFFRWRPFGFHRCAHQKADSDNLVTRSSAGEYCSIMRGKRTTNPDCNPEARWFEPVVYQAHEQPFFTRLMRSLFG